MIFGLKSKCCTAAWLLAARIAWAAGTASLGPGGGTTASDAGPNPCVAHTPTETCARVNDATLNNYGPGTTSKTVFNRQPVANAGPNQSVKGGTDVTLDGTRSSDEDHDKLTYQWVQDNTNPNTPLVNLRGSTTARPAFTAPTVQAETVLKFTLKVRDGTEAMGAFKPTNSESDLAVVTITITPESDLDI